MPKPHPKTLTFDERKKIEEGLSSGLSGSKIARSLGRSVNAISYDVRINGGRLSYTAAKAQESSVKRLLEKYQRVSDTATTQKTQYYMKQRLENLEMQVEILHEAIKELMNR